MPFESLLEQDWLVQTDAFEFDLDSIQAQPMEVRYRFDGRSRVWVPDFLKQVRKQTPVLVEVKPHAKVYPENEHERAFVKAMFEHRQVAARAMGYDFALATELEIRVEPRLYNANMMRRCAQRHFPQEWERAGLNALVTLPSKSSVANLQRNLGNTADAFAVALRMAWLGVIRLDPTRRWSHSTSFERTDRPL